MNEYKGRHNEEYHYSKGIQQSMMKKKPREAEEEKMITHEFTEGEILEKLISDGEMQ